MNKLAHTFTVSDMKMGMGGSTRDAELQKFLDTFPNNKRRLFDPNKLFDPNDVGYDGL